MRRFAPQFLTFLIILIAGSIFALAGLVGGPAYPADVTTIHALAAERGEHSWLTKLAAGITQVGSAEALLAILALALVALGLARRWRDALVLAGTVIGGRLAIELLKLAIDRQRPSFNPYPVEVHSLSFPSGHAGNSMITLLAIAMILTPPRWRGRAMAAAVVGSLLIGATRPLLGVHWPSDVVGGWSFGIAWVVGLLALTHRWRGAAK